MILNGVQCQCIELLLFQVKHVMQSLFVSIRIIQKLKHVGVFSSYFVWYEVIGQKVNDFFFENLMKKKISNPIMKNWWFFSRKFYGKQFLIRMLLFFWTLELKLNLIRVGKPVDCFIGEQGTWRRKKFQWLAS